MLWDILENGHIIDIVCVDSNFTADEVKRSLINHDGYSPVIEVVPHVNPLYDVSYLVEKATMIIHSANEIINATRMRQTESTRSYYVGGVLEIEQALNGLHTKIRSIMKACDETEKDYGLREMGEVKIR